MDNENSDQGDTVQCISESLTSSEVKNHKADQSAKELEADST